MADYSGGSESFTAQQLAECARRELTYRIRVYKGLIAAGKMKPEKANRECNMMRAIHVHFDKLAEKERLL